MAHGGDGFFIGIEIAHDGNHALVEAQVFGRAAAGNHEADVIVGVDLVKIVIEGEIVASFFAISLLAFEIVHGRGDIVAGLFVGANGVHGVA